MLKIFSLLVLSVFTFATAYGAENQKLDCRVIKPACFPMLSSAGTGGADFDLLTPDKQIRVVGSFDVTSYDSPESIFQIQLTDTQSGATASASGRVHDDMTLFQGVEDFKGSNGTTYSVVCAVSRYKTGSEPQWTSPCPDGDIAAAQAALSSNADEP